MNGDGIPPGPLRVSAGPATGEEEMTCRIAKLATHF